MSRWTLKEQLLTTLVAIASLFAAVGYNSFHTVTVLNQHLATIADTDAAAMQAAARLQFLSMKLSSSADMIVVAGYDKDRVAIDQELASASASYAQLSTAAAEIDAVSQVPANHDRARAVVTAMAEWQKLVIEAAEHARAFRTAEASEAMAKSEAFSDDKAAKLAAEILAAESENLTAARASAAATTRTAQGFMVALSGLVVVVLLAVGWVQRRMFFSIRHVSVDLRDGAGEVAMASNQMASFAQSLATGSSEQAAALQQTSTSMEEMSTTTRENADRCAQAARKMADTEQLLSDAGGALQQLVSSMDEIQASSGKVSKIIRTIEEIAFQTNILALNAAVEAARAGEAGRGFAVVADEVRNLAQRSSEAARDTALLIAESAETAASGGTRVAAVETSMAAINASSSEVKSLIDQVTVASRAQAQGVDDVRRSVVQIERVTQNTAATSEGSAAASEELHAQAEQTLGTIAILEAMVGLTAPSRHERTDAPVRPAASAGLKHAA